MKNISTILKIFTPFLILSISACVTPDLKRTNDGTKIYSETENIKGNNIIAGLITDSKTLKPVQNAIIEIKNSSRGIGYYKTTTDSDGSYKIRDFMPNINYEISVTAVGYVSYNSTSRISSSKKNIRLTKESIISGKVTDSHGRPLSGIEIKLKKYTGYYGSVTTRPVFTKTDKNGYYKFLKLNSGSYLLTYTAAGYITESARVKQVRKDETFKLGMVMYKPSSITGSVKIKGLNVPAVDINIMARGRYSYSNVTYQDGSFQLEGLKPGRYRISLSHQGFKKIRTSYINLNENSSKKLNEFKIEAKQPEIKVHSYRYIFTPGNALQFNFKSLRMNSVHVKVYKVPMEFIISEQKDPDLINPKLNKFKKIMEWDEAVKKFNPYRWMYYPVTINKALSTGGYCIEARGKGGAITRKLFTVTNIGVVMKRSPGKFFAYATDLVKNKPVKNAQVYIYKHSKYKYKKGKKHYQIKSPQRIEDLPLTIIKKGKTDSNGIFKSKLNINSRMSLVVLNNDGSYAICSAGNPSFYKSEKEKFYIYTERPVYRAGDTVNFKIIAKKRKSKFIPIKNKRIYIKVSKGYRSSPILSTNIYLDEWGTASGSFKIPVNSKLGSYSIRTGFNKKNLYGYHYFHIEQYRKPEFKVEILPTKKFYINDDRAEFKVEAKYFFGAPLKNAIIKYRFYEKKIKRNRDYYSRNSYSKIKLEGEKFSDKNGAALLKIDSGNLPYDREITLEATVTDRSNISITTKKTVKIGRGEFYISIKPSKNFFGSNEKKNVIIKTIDHSGKPVSANVTLKLYRYIWKPVQMVYVHDRRPYYTKTITTDKNGRLSVKLPKKFTGSGEFDLIATARDGRDNLIKDSQVIWIYNNNGGSIASRFKNLEVSIDKSKLGKPGTVTCLVKSRFKDSYVWLTLEGRDIYESRVIKMNKNIVPVKFQIKGNYAPNLFIRSAMQRKRALYTTVNRISIPTKDIKLKVKITPSKEKYGPGETVKLKISTKDQKGRAISSDLSIAAVDESIFSIRRDNTAEISQHFYSKISNWVMTSYSYPITLLAGAQKNSPEKVRENFKDTAFWKANIKTGKNGLAYTEFKLPDNLTTWRLTARGHDKDGRMGQSKKKIISTRSIISRIGKPRFMIEKDDINLIGIVNNNTDKGISSISTKFSIDGKELAPKSKHKISLPEYGSARKYYSYTVPSGKKNVSIKFRSSTGRESDTVLHRVPVEKRGLKYTIYGTGDNESNKTINLKSLKDTSDFEFVPETLEISVFPSIILQMMKSIKYLNKYPYGCVEQTINKFMPALALNELIKKGNYSSLINQGQLSKLRTNIRKGIGKIENAQNYDGTWGWWSGDRGNASLTAYAVYSLRRAKLSGYSTNRNKLRKGIRALGRMLKSGNIDNEELSYIFYIYSLNGKWNKSAFKKLSLHKNTSPYMAANLLRASEIRLRKNNIYRTDKRELEENHSKFQKIIIQSANSDSKGIYWPSTSKQSWSWAGGRAEMTAHVLSAISKSKKYSKLGSKALLSLSKRFNGTSWKSTKETAMVIFAVCDYLKDKNYDYKPKGNLKFSLNNKDITEIKFNLDENKNINNLSKTIELTDAMKNKVYKLNMNGSASKDLIYTAKLNGTLYFKPKGLFSFMKSETRGIKSISNGITARRDIFYLSRIKDMKMQEYLVPSSLSERSKILIGDEMLIKIKFKAKESLNFLMLQDYLPSGFEVVKKDAYNGYRPYSHVERRDNRMLYFFTGIKKGQEYEIAYIIRAELPGKFIMRPGKIECMYEPSLQGWSQPSIIEVNEKE